MRRFLWFSTFILLISGAAAQTSAGSKAGFRKPIAEKPSASARVTAQEVQELRDALAAQQRQSEEQRQQLDQLKSQLQQLLDATQQASATAQKVQGNAEQAQATAAQAQQSAAEAQRQADQVSSSVTETKTALALVDTQSKDERKKLNALQDALGRFRFVGDIRVRGEDFFQDCSSCVTRNRARFRLRFGLEGKLNDDFAGGFLLTSGSLGDSNSTNETLTNFFTRKTIGIDRAYVTYHPLAAKWISLTGGKFGFTWQRTPMTFDSDLNPEGFTEKFSFDLKSPVIKNFTVQGIQLLYNEASKGDDSFAVGGQVSSKLDFGFMDSTASFSLLDWRFPDAILGASVLRRTVAWRRARVRHRFRVSHHGAVRLWSSRLYQRHLHGWGRQTSFPLRVPLCRLYSEQPDQDRLESFPRQPDAGIREQFECRQPPAGLAGKCPDRSGQAIARLPGRFQSGATEEQE